MVKVLSKVKYHIKSGFRHGFKNVIFSKFFFGFIASLSVLLSSHDKAGRIKDNLDARFNDQEDTFDFIVVGGGSAGSIVANRLSEGHKVLLLEAGGEPHPLQRIPGMAFFLLNYKQTDWMHRTVPQRRACFASPGRRSSWSQGRNLGGSGNLNWLVHLRGSPRDYDYWAKLTGDESWSYAGILPYFRRHENYQGDSPDREAHGFDGELKLEIPSYTGMAKEFIRAGQELGYEHVDLNARYEEGFDTIYYPLEGGERKSSFAAFLEPIRERETLVIRKYAHVNRILIRGFDNTAFGVEYERHGRKRYAYATKEVILSAGTVESAKLLMLSGVGPKTHLADLGIPVVADLPVGKNLQDHLATFVGPFFIDPPRSFLIDRDITLKSFYEYKSDGNGPLSTSLFQAAAMVSSKQAKRAGIWNWPDIQLLLSGMAGHKTFPTDIAHAFNLNTKTMKKYYEHGLGRDSFFIAVSASRPMGRGEIVLEKKDPYAPTTINPRYLENDHDMRIMIEGIKTALYLVENTTSFQNLRARFTSKKFPGCEHMPFRSDDYFECYVRHLSVSMNDYVGTCAMGHPHMGKDGVLDSQLQVIGINHLRVIDASVMPTIVGSGTESAVMMIAEKGSDMIMEGWRNREVKDPFVPAKGHGHNDHHHGDHGPGEVEYGPPPEKHPGEDGPGPTPVSFQSYGPPATIEVPPNLNGGYGPPGHENPGGYNNGPPGVGYDNGPPGGPNSPNNIGPQGPNNPDGNHNFNNGPPNFDNGPGNSNNHGVGNGHNAGSPSDGYNGPPPPLPDNPPAYNGPKQDPFPGEGGPNPNQNVGGTPPEGQNNNNNVPLTNYNNPSDQSNQQNSFHNNNFNNNGPNQNGNFNKFNNGDNFNNPGHNFNNGNNGNNFNNNDGNNNNGKEFQNNNGNNFNNGNNNGNSFNSGNFNNGNNGNNFNNGNNNFNNNGNNFNNNGNNGNNGNNFNNNGNNFNNNGNGNNFNNNGSGNNNGNSGDSKNFNNGGFQQPNSFNSNNQQQPLSSYGPFNTAGSRNEVGYSTLTTPPLPEITTQMSITSDVRGGLFDPRNSNNLPPQEDNEVSTTEISTAVMLPNYVGSSAVGDPPEENAPTPNSDFVTEASTNSPRANKPTFFEQIFGRFYDADSKATTEASVNSPSTIVLNSNWTKFDQEGNSSSQENGGVSATRPDVTLLNHDTKMRPGVQISNPFPDSYYAERAAEKLKEESQAMSAQEFRLKYPLTSSVEYTNRIPNPPELGPVYFRNPEYTTRSPIEIGESDNLGSGSSPSVGIATRVPIPDPPGGYNHSMIAAARTVAMTVAASDVYRIVADNNRKRRPYYEGNFQPHVVFKSAGVTNKIPSTASVPDIYYTMKDQSSKDHINGEMTEGPLATSSIASGGYWTNPSTTTTEQPREGSGRAFGSGGDTLWSSPSASPIVQYKDPNDPNKHPWIPLGEQERQKSEAKKQKSWKDFDEDAFNFEELPAPATSAPYVQRQETTTEATTTTTSGTTTTPKPRRVVRIREGVNWSTTTTFPPTTPEPERYFETTSSASHDAIVNPQPFEHGRHRSMNSQVRQDTTTTKPKIKVRIRHKNTPAPEVNRVPDEEGEIRIKQYPLEQFNEQRLPEESSDKPVERPRKIRIRTRPRGSKQVVGERLKIRGNSPVTITPRPLLSVTLWPDDNPASSESEEIRQTQSTLRPQRNSSYGDNNSSKNDKETPSKSRNTFDHEGSSTLLISSLAGAMMKAFGGNSGESYKDKASEDEDGNNGDSINSATHNLYRSNSPSRRPLTHRPTTFPPSFQSPTSSYAQEELSPFVTQVPEFYAKDSDNNFVRPPYHIDQNNPTTFDNNGRNQQGIGQNGQGNHFNPSLTLSTPQYSNRPPGRLRRPTAPGFSNQIVNRYNDNSNNNGRYEKFPTSFRELSPPPPHSLDATTPTNDINNAPTYNDESPLQFGQPTVNNVYEHSTTSAPRFSGSTPSNSRDIYDNQNNGVGFATTQRPYHDTINNDNFGFGQNSNVNNNNNDYNFNDHNSREIGLDGSIRNNAGVSNFGQSLEGNLNQNAQGNSGSPNTFQIPIQSNYPTQSNQEERYPQFFDSQRDFNSGTQSNQQQTSNDFNNQQSNSQSIQNQNFNRQDDQAYLSDSHGDFTSGSQASDQGQQGRFQSASQSFQESIGVNTEHFVDQNLGQHGIDPGQVSITFDDTGSTSLLDHPVLSSPDVPEPIKKSNVDISQISLTDSDGHIIQEQPPVADNVRSNFDSQSQNNFGSQSQNNFDNRGQDVFNSQAQQNNFNGQDFQTNQQPAANHGDPFEHAPLDNSHLQGHRQQSHRNFGNSGGFDGNSNNGAREFHGSSTISPLHFPSSPDNLGLDHQGFPQGHSVTGAPDHFSTTGNGPTTVSPSYEQFLNPPLPPSQNEQANFDLNQQNTQAQNNHVPVHNDNTHSQNFPQDGQHFIDPTNTFQNDPTNDQLAVPPPPIDNFGQPQDQQIPYDGLLTHTTPHNSPSSSTARPLSFGSRLNRHRNRDPLSNFGEAVESNGFTFDPSSNTGGFTESPPNYDYTTTNDPNNGQGFQSSTFRPTQRPFKLGPPEPNNKEYTIFSDPDSVDLTEDPVSKRLNHLQRRADILQRRRKRRRNFWRHWRRGGDEEEDEDGEQQRPFRPRRQRRPHSRRRLLRVENYPFAKAQRRSDDGVVEDEEVSSVSTSSLEDVPSSSSLLEKRMSQPVSQSEKRVTQGSKRNSTSVFSSADLEGLLHRSTEAGGRLIKKDTQGRSSSGNEPSKIKVDGGQS